MTVSSIITVHHPDDASPLERTETFDIIDFYGYNVSINTYSNTVFINSIQ